MDFAKALDPGLNLDEDSQARDEQKPMGMSLEQVKPRFVAYIDATEKMVADLNAIDITGDESLNLAVEKGGAAKRLVKAIDRQADDLTFDAKGYVKSVVNFAKRFTDALTQSVKGVEKKIGDHQYRQEIKRRGQEAAARVAAADLQKSINEEAAAAGVEAPVVAVPVIPEDKGQVKTDTGITAYQKSRMKADIVDPEQVPREYCSPDTKKINAAVRAGVREIAGVRIYEDKKTVLRT